jgi:hypothetical protein
MLIFRSMEILQDLNTNYKSKPINLLTTTTYLPKQYHHSSRRLNYHRLLNEIDWNYEIERERDNRDRRIYNEKVMEIKTRRSRPRTTHHKTLNNEKYKSVDRGDCLIKTRVVLVIFIFFKLRVF